MSDQSMQAPSAPATEKSAAEKEALEKEGSDRLRAFQIGIGACCKDLGMTYDDLAKHAGVAPEALGPALVDAMADAAERQQSQGQVQA